MCKFLTPTTECGCGNSGAPKVKPTQPWPEGPPRRAEMPGNPSRQLHSQPASQGSGPEPATKAPCRDWHRSGAQPGVVELRPASAGPWGAPIVQGHAEKLGRRTWGLKDGHPGLERRGPGPKRKGRGLRPLGTLRSTLGSPPARPTSPASASSPGSIRKQPSGSGNSRADPEAASAVTSECGNPPFARRRWRRLLRRRSRARRAGDGSRGLVREGASGPGRGGGAGGGAERGSWRRKGW